MRGELEHARVQLIIIKVKRQFMSLGWTRNKAKKSKTERISRRDECAQEIATHRLLCGRQFISQRAQERAIPALSAVPSAHFTAPLQGECAERVVGVSNQERKFLDEKNHESPR